MSGSVRGIVNQAHQQTLVTRRDLDMSTRQTNKPTIAILINRPLRIE